MLISNVDGVYVIHAKEGYEYHGLRVKQLLDEMGLAFEFVSDRSPDTFTSELLHAYFSDEMILKNPSGILSCTFNHLRAYELMVERNQQLAIIFEDDPFFLKKFIKGFNLAGQEMAELKDAFIISLENTTLNYPSYFQTKKGQYLYKAISGRAAGAYVINLVAAQNILHEVYRNGCHIFIDLFHNHMSDQGMLKIYWMHPPLVEQGSHNGRLGTGNSRNHTSLIRRMKWDVMKFIRFYFKRLLPQRRILVD